MNFNCFVSAPIDRWLDEDGQKPITRYGILIQLPEIHFFPHKIVASMKIISITIKGVKWDNVLLVSAFTFNKILQYDQIEVFFRHQYCCFECIYLYGKYSVCHGYFVNQNHSYPWHISHRTAFYQTKVPHHNFFSLIYMPPMPFSILSHRSFSYLLTWVCVFFFSIWLRCLHFINMVESAYNASFKYVCRCFRANIFQIKLIANRNNTYSNLIDCGLNQTEIKMDLFVCFLCKINCSTD